MEIIALENLPDDDPVGPRGAGEISVNVTAPAVANAIAAATGFSVRSLPVKPDDILDYLENTP